MEEPRPDFESRLVVAGLAFGAVIGLLLVPLRTAVFLLRRKRIRKEISRLIEEGRDP